MLVRRPIRDSNVIVGLIVTNMIIHLESSNISAASACPAVRHPYAAYKLLVRLKYGACTHHRCTCMRLPVMHHACELTTCQSCTTCIRVPQCDMRPDCGRITEMKRMCACMYHTKAHAHALAESAQTLRSNNLSLCTTCAQSSDVVVVHSIIQQSCRCTATQNSAGYACRATAIVDTASASPGLMPDNMADNMTTRLRLERLQGLPDTCIGPCRCNRAMFAI